MNIEKIRKELEEIKTRKTKTGLYIYGKYVVYFIDNSDIQNKRKDSKEYVENLINSIKRKEKENLTEVVE